MPDAIPVVCRGCVSIPRQRLFGLLGNRFQIGPCPQGTVERQVPKRVDFNRRVGDGINLRWRVLGTAVSSARVWTLWKIQDIPPSNRQPGSDGRDHCAQPCPDGRPSIGLPSGMSSYRVCAWRPRSEMGYRHWRRGAGWIGSSDEPGGLRNTPM